MSKYYKLEDIKDALIGLSKSGKRLERETTTNIIKALGNLPAIEADEDCISREQIIEAHYEWCNQHQGETDVFYTWSLRLMRDAPSVVPSRAEGEWIMHVDDLFPCESTQECSVCHSQHLICGNDDNYCPYCGAYMKG